MRKKAILILTVVLLAVVGSLVLTSCGTPLSAEEAFKIFQNGLQAAEDAEFYFYEEVDNRDPKNRINRKVNVIGEVNDENVPVLDVNSNYINYKASIYEKTSAKGTPSHVLEYKVGQPENSEEGAVSYLTKRDATDKYKDTKKVEIRSRKEMTTEELVESKLFESYSLDNKVKDLQMLTLDDIDLEKTWKQSLSTKKASFIKKAYLVTLEFVIKPEYFEKNCPDSSLKGDMIHIEIVDGKLYNIIVYQYISDGSMTTFDEVYRFCNVYRGPKVEVPKLETLNDEEKGYPIVDNIL